MSYVPPEEFHLSEEGTSTGLPFLPQSAQNQASQGESNFIDGSGPLFTMYAEMAEEEDKKMAESWKGDADGILIFTGLFSAAVAALTAVSIQDLRPNPQDASAFYLANIYQLLADPNGTNVTVPPTLSRPPAFSPPKYAIWVNGLWFLSLAISLTCALLATLLQQWARRYIKNTQPRNNPHKRARIRAFFAEGVDNLHLPTTVEALPALLHISLFLFFAGLLVFLFNINHTVFSVVAWWIVLCTGVYACITLMPIFRHDSPYYAPLSSSAWYIYTGTLCVLFQVLQWFSLKIYEYRATRNRFRFGNLERRYRKRFLEGVRKTVEETARSPSPGVDYRALMWTFDSLDDDHELERFFAGVPGLCNSLVVQDPLRSFIEPNMTKLSVALTGLLDRTMTSNLVPDPIKQRRSIICMRAMDAVSFALDRWIFDRLFTGEWDGLLSSVEFGLFVMKARYDHPLPAFYSQSMVSVIIARVQEHDHRWVELVTGQLGISEIVLQNYLAHGDSVLLANLIYICRLTMETYPQYHWSRRTDSRSKTFESVSKLDAPHTLPALQHLFCSLWNELVLKARNDGESPVYSLSLLILRHIRNIYITLHHGTFAAPTAFSSSTADDDDIMYLSSSYPLCNIESHCAVPLDTVHYNPRVINTAIDYDVHFLASRQRSRVPFTPLSSIPFPPHMHSGPGPLTNEAPMSFFPTRPSNLPSFHGPFCYIAPTNSARPSSRPSSWSSSRPLSRSSSAYNVTQLAPRPEPTQNAFWMHNSFWSLSNGDHVDSLAVPPVAALTDGAPHSADRQNLSVSSVHASPESAAVSPASAVALSPGVSQGTAAPDSGAMSSMEVFGQHESSQISNVGSRMFAGHHLRRSTSASADIPMGPFPPPEDPHPPWNQADSPLPGTSEAHTR